ncbi:MAG TPA: triose-phosphate isomerase [Thermoplasmata archaeon]|nr:triose-phosphate isomerase [Thermoplasmata archaeon]
MPTRDAPLGLPLFLLNLKTYRSALGRNGLKIGAQLARLGRKAGVAVALAPATPDLAWLARELPIPVLAQHVDPAPAGPGTGFVPVESALASGARGSLVNHSEDPVARSVVGRLVALLGSHRMTAVVCAGTVEEARRLAAFRPPYLAIEPPELIGGDVAVSSARPELISKSVAAVRRVAPRTQVLCGAGIHGREDVAKSLELGSRGILVASAVTKAADPTAAIRELLRGF